jgi:hypothetical protein
MRRVHVEYGHITLGARVIVLWHGKEREGIVFHRSRGSGRLRVRLLDNGSLPEVPPERYVCTLRPESERVPPADLSSLTRGCRKQATLPLRFPREGISLVCVAENAQTQPA